MPKLIKVQGRWYRQAEDGGGGPPAGFGLTNPADPKALLPDSDGNERKVTKIKPQDVPNPFDPRIERELTRLQKKVEKLESIVLSGKSLRDLVETYDLPSAQILLVDWKASKARLLGHMNKLIEDLRGLSREDAE